MSKIKKLDYNHSVEKACDEASKMEKIRRKKNVFMTEEEHQTEYYEVVQEYLLEEVFDKINELIDKSNP